MYLTRFRFNTARTGARKLLSAPQAMHAAVLGGFPGVLPSDTEKPRVLWRIDRRAKAEVFLYVVAPDEPDYTHLVEQAGWPESGTLWETRDYGPFLDRLAAGGVWEFRLTANPVHHIRRRDGEDTKATAHLTGRHQMGWLLERAEASGFRVVEKPPERRRLPAGDEYELLVSDRHRLEIGKNGRRGKGGPVRLVTATFDGRLEVTDPEALRRTLVRGLGRAKGYGCGLMTLAPVPGRAS